MTTLLDRSKLHLQSFDPKLAAALGDQGNEIGSHVLASAAVHGRRQVLIRDWFYALARHPGTLVRRHLIERFGKSEQTFIASVESGCTEVPELQGLPPRRLTSETVAAEVLSMLAEAETLARQSGDFTITDAALTLALLTTAPSDLTQMLRAWTGDDAWQEFDQLVRSDLQSAPRDIELFHENGQINPSGFTPSGRQFCRRLAEEVTSLGVSRLTTRHFLYTILDNEQGLLSTALTIQGIDVKRDLHAVLVRELHRSKKRATKLLEISRDNIFGPVRELLKAACCNAQSRRAPGVSEFDIEQAFGRTQLAEITRLIPHDQRWDPTSFTELLQNAEPPEEEVLETQPSRCAIQEIEDQIRGSIHGQDDAIRRMLPWIKRLRFGLPRDDRPAGVFLFIGPTGTGKTQMAKELARSVFGRDDDLLFLEMSQFKTRESISGLIGAPPGYVGYGEGKLTNGLRDKPECVVLFDEIEKSLPTAFDVVLRFADEGLISDPAGPVRDGRRCILVLTTNAGQGWLVKHLSAHPAALDEPGQLSRELLAAAEQELRDLGFRTEFLGRVDESIVFVPLSQQTCERIVNGVLDCELDRFCHLKGIELCVEVDVRCWLANQVYARSLKEGARCAPRVINQDVLTPAIDLATDYEARNGEGIYPKRIRAYLDPDKVVRLEIRQ